MRDVWRRGLWIALMALCLGLPGGLSQADITPVGVEVPLHASDTPCPVVTVTLQGPRGETRARLLVDTGANYTVISPGLAKQLGLKPGRERLPVMTANGGLDVPLVQLPQISIGRVAVKEVPVAVHELGNPGFSGLLGMNVLGRMEVRLSPGRLVLVPPA